MPTLRFRRSHGPFEKLLLKPRTEAICQRFAVLDIAKKISRPWGAHEIPTRGQCVPVRPASGALILRPNSRRHLTLSPTVSCSLLSRFRSRVCFLVIGLVCKQQPARRQERRHRVVRRVCPRGAPFLCAFPQFAAGALGPDNPRAFVPCQGGARELQRGGKAFGRGPVNRYRSCGCRAFRPSPASPRRRPLAAAAPPTDFHVG